MTVSGVTRRAAIQAAFAVPITGATAQGAQAVTVFAAVSLAGVLDDLARRHAAARGLRVVASYGATSALARQIEQGAPADIFFSADLEWMQWAETRGLVSPQTRVDLLGNRLVLVASRAANPPAIQIAPGFDLARLLGPGNRLAVGDVRAVPVGRYAREALMRLGVWPQVERRLAQAENARVALTLVARGEAPLGIVYETDARGVEGVVVLGTFPADSHAPIVYPVAATVNARPSAAAYLRLLRSAAARSVFTEHGFSVLAQVDPNG